MKFILAAPPSQSDILSKANTYTIRNTYFVINNLKPGTYYWSVKAVDQAQSASAYAPEQSFTISSKPVTPVISFNGSALLSNATDGNQWYDKNGPVAGATRQSLVPLTNGTYYVIVSANGCSSDTSNKIQVILSDVKNDAATDLIKVFPNPVDDVLTLETSEALGAIPFQITNSLGQPIYEGILNVRIQISTKEFPAGLYTITFSKEKLMLVKNLIKE
ncbi:MAG: T9SS type A sorting domain-containing protein [Saprospiraceae bacterium]|nr:T9SS type A sorting domain-containing protein [Candidatus Vicinibacter affinis]